MSLQRWIWAAPIVFIIHGAEEIATMAPWLETHRAQLPTMVRPLTIVTMAQFAVAVGVLVVGVLLAAVHGASQAVEHGLAQLRLALSSRCRSSSRCC